MWCDSSFPSIIHCDYTHTHTNAYTRTQDQAQKEKAMAGLSAMSSAQIVSASLLQNTASARMFGTPGVAGNAVPMHTMLNSPGTIDN